MNGRSRKIAWTLALSLCVGLTPVGCKEGNPIGSGIVPATPDFVAGSSTAPDHKVSLRKSSVDGGRIVLDIVVADVNENVSGIAIKLTYPNAFSRFTRCLDGDLFTQGSCFFAEPGQGSGEVFVGRSVTDPAQATPVSGERVIASVEFLVFGVDSGPITIENQNLGGSDSSALLDEQGGIIQVDWSSGMLVGI